MSVNKLRLADGTLFDLVGGCYGGKEYVRDVLRECLEFRLAVTALTLDQADALFTADNCATLAIIEEVAEEVPVTNVTEKLDENGDPVLDDEGNPVTEAVTTYETQIKEVEYIHEGYTVRVNLAKRDETVLLSDDTTTIETFICIKMAQQSEAEKLQEELDATNAAYDDLVLEFLGV